MLVGIFAFMSFNAIDTYFVAQLGVAELAAMSFTFPVVMFISSIAIGLGAGASSCVSRAIGSGDQAQARRLITDVMVFAFLISVLVSILGLLTIEPLFLALGAAPELIPLLKDYMLPWYVGVVFVIVPMVAMSVFRALGNAGLSGKVMVAAAVLNTILDPLLIFGLLGFPRMELQGAAVATLLARGATFIVAAVYLSKNRLLSSPLGHRAKMFASWRAVLHVGMPAMATNMIIPLAGAVVVAMVATYGQEAVAGMGVALRVEPVALIFFYALSSVIGPFCGQNLGAGRIDRLQESLRVITRFSLLAGGCLAVLLWWLAEPVVSAFTRSDEALRVAVLYLHVVPVSYGLYGLVMSVNASFNGIGRPFPGVTISTGRVLLLYLPLALLFQQVFALRGLFYATALSNLVLGLLAYFWLRHTLNQLVSLPSQR